MNKVWTQIWKTVCKGADVPTDTVDLQLAVNECLYTDDSDYSHITESNLFKAMYAASRDDTVLLFMQARYNKAALFSFFNCSSWQEILDKIRSKPIIPFEVVLNMKRPSQAIQILHKLQFDTGDYTAIPIGNGSLDDWIARNVDINVETCGMLHSPKWTFEKRKKALLDFIFKGKNNFKIKMYNMNRQQTPGQPTITPFRFPDDDDQSARTSARITRQNQFLPMAQQTPHRPGLFATPTRVTGAGSPPYGPSLYSPFARVGGQANPDFAYRNPDLERELDLFSPNFVRQLELTRKMTRSIVEVMRDVPMRYTMDELHQIARDPRTFRALAELRGVELSAVDDQPQTHMETMFMAIGLNDYDAQFFGYSDAELDEFAQHSNIPEVVEAHSRLDKIQWVIAAVKGRTAFRSQLLNLPVDEMSMRELIKQSCIEKFSRMTASLCRANARNMEMRTDTEVRQALTSECIRNAFANGETKLDLVKAIIRSTPASEIQQFINQHTTQMAPIVRHQQPLIQMLPTPPPQPQSSLLTARREEFFGRRPNVNVDVNRVLSQIGVSNPGSHPWWTLITTLQSFETGQASAARRADAQTALGVPNLKQFLNQEQAAVADERDPRFQVANLGLVLRASNSLELADMGRNAALDLLVPVINDLDMPSPRQLAVLNRYFNIQTDLAGIQAFVNTQNFGYNSQF